MVSLGPRPTSRLSGGQHGPAGSPLREPRWRPAAPCAPNLAGAHSWGVRWILDNLSCWFLEQDKPGEAGTFLRSKRDPRGGSVFWTHRGLPWASSCKEPRGSESEVQPQQHPPVRELAAGRHAPGHQEKEERDVEKQKEHSSEQQKGTKQPASREREQTFHKVKCEGLSLKIHAGVHQQHRPVHPTHLLYSVLCGVKTQSNWSGSFAPKYSYK